MRIPQSYIQKCKVVAHVFQVLFIFIAACITIGVFTKGGDTGGATKFFFALCFLSIPALIYLVMTPMWSRAERFVNAYAFVALDALYTIFWFAAFISVAMWNSKGIKEGEKDKKINEGDGNCTTFKFGPEAMCKLSRATVGFGIVIFIFFGLTTAISAYYLIKFRRDGILPFQSATPNPRHLGGETSGGGGGKDNTWSSEYEAPGRESDEEDRHTERGGNQEEDEYALLHSTETDEGRHPGRPLSWGDDRYNRAPAPPYAGYDDDAAANALSPGGYEEYRREAGAPQPPHGGGYGNGGQGYSFSGGDR
ncbi:uncharacterized protein BDR25DRAFT_332308 [Lindgomyces ingoldianus]|uniref:Uncharacterized protein n=1 Tax=Lindgomyces ingoldianus TaxID=673940 RepID=A0ACB6R5K7_9PLEO|nr:uncharacterized protein BDR25DRAFT_332308 [Lindgomyces ingoldianus]KAF2474128.1 hypothetical protein BDR25DRAFT_332308 [Lindgomyces ingoldianus]